MDRTPSELLKPLASRLAQRAMAREVETALRLLDLAHGANALDRQQRWRMPPPTAPNSDGRIQVGIWEGTPASGFARSEHLRFQWPIWADVPKILPKGQTRRVVLLGESVARGYFYDPQFTVAKTLGLMLKSAMGSKVEVVDLACVAILLPELKKTFEASLELSPDVVVFFAGNNWGNATSRSASLVDQWARIDAVRERGIAGLVQQCKDELASEVRDFYDFVHAKCAARGTKVVLVVPEFNLADWPDAQAVIPLMIGDGAERWRAYFQRAQRALGAGNFEEAALAAAKMIEVDQGINGLGSKILAQCKLRSGRFSEARKLFEQSRDADLWDPITTTPRCYGVLQDVMRQAALAHPFHVVDLPRVIESHLDGALPDRRMFLDYCHLTVEGIRVAMAATAETILPLLGAGAASRSELLRTEVPISNRVEGLAHFAAAIHNAHWLCGSDSLIEYHCRTALEKSPEIAGMMLDYADSRTRRAPVWMCESTLRLSLSAKNPRLVDGFWGTQQDWTKTLDRPLFDAFAQCAGGERKVEDVRIAERALDIESTNLLSVYFATSAPAHREGFWRIRSEKPAGSEEGFWNAGGSKKRWPDYFKAYDLESKFAFIAKKPASVRLRISARLPKLASPAGRLAVEVNGRFIDEIELSSAWRSSAVEVRADVIRSGINDIVLRWPPPTSNAAAGLEQAAIALETDTIPEYYPVFGEVHSLTAQLKDPRESA